MPTFDLQVVDVDPACVDVFPSGTSIAGDTGRARPLPCHDTGRARPLGDVVSETVDDLAEVEVIMPLGSDPHDFAPSARQDESVENADLVVVNGAGFEEGMLDIIDNVSDSGTEIFSFADEVDLLDFSGEGREDPHIWTDPTRIAAALEALEPGVAGLDGIDASALSESFDAYLGELDDLGHRWTTRSM